jgi:L-lactate dehydrogenase complex protein LldG
MNDTATARNAILARLKGAAWPAATTAPNLAAFRRERPGFVAPDAAARRERFVEQARAWRAEIIACSPDDWPAAARAALDQRGARKIAFGTDTWIAGPLEAVLADKQRLDLRRPIETWKAELFDEIDAAITTTVGGIAETGTLIVVPDAREPRTLSLVPPVHVAVLRASQLHDTLAGALAALAPQRDMPTNFLLISGPSKTADIQMTLAYGAHGPKELIVLLIDDGATPATDGRPS